MTWIAASRILAQADWGAGAGWTGAGLLGMVLSWLLLKHLPEKDKLTLDLMEAGYQRLDSQRREFTESIQRLMTAFREEAAAERLACEKHYQALAETMNLSFKTLGEQLSAHSVRNQQWLELLKGELAKYGLQRPSDPGRTLP